MKKYQLFKSDEVEGLRVGKFGYRINTSCIVYRIGSTVIDTGPANQWKVVKKFLDEKEVKQVVITHHHEDHGGNGANIKDEMNVPVMVHPSAREKYQTGYPLKFYEKVVWGKPRNFSPVDLPETVEVGNGINLKAIHTPGHCEDMTCYLEENKGWLFTGDLFIATKPKFIRQDENPNIEIQSLKKILEYDFGKVFCSHRGIVKEGRRAIQNKLDYMENLKDNVHNLHKQGRDIDEITKMLIGKETITSILTLYHFSKRNLIMAFARSF